jgi:hypothetical protein
VPGIVPTAVAANTAAPSAAPDATAQVPDTAGTTNAFAVAAARPVVAGAEPAFRSLFRNGDSYRDGRGAVAPIVSELWGAAPAKAPASGTQSAPGVTAQAVEPTSAAEPLDLFRDMRPDVRSLFKGSGRA